MGLTFFRRVLRNLCNGFLDILFPSLCLHCEANLEAQRRLFCNACLEQLRPVDLHDRCPICFSEGLPCRTCASSKTHFRSIKRQAFVCDPFGPVHTLAAYLNNGNTRFIPAAGSLMALQCASLQWPLPDLIVPLPVSIGTRCKKGCDITALLAKEIAYLLDRPSASLLRASFDRRAFLEKGEFQTRFHLIQRKKEKVMDQRILLIALVLDEDALEKAALTLLEGFASEICALGIVKK